MAPQSLGDKVAVFITMGKNILVIPNHKYSIIKAKVFNTEIIIAGVQKYRVRYKSGKFLWRG